MRNRMRAGLALALLALLLAATSPAGANVQNPDEVVREVAGNLLDALGENGDAYRDNPEQLEELVRRDLLPALDVEYSARLILGRAGRGATPEQITAFADTMAEVLISRYATGMLEYQDRRQLEVLPLRGELNERATRVRTRVQTTKGAFNPVDYLLRKTDDGRKALDVIVDGI